MESWLARAIALSAKTRPDLALRFWREDPRRLGELADEQGAGEALCKALVATGAALSAHEAAPLIAAVCAADRYPEPVEPEREALRIEVNDQHRLDLLRLLPVELLGAQGSAELTRLTTQYPEHVSSPVRYREPRAGWVGSPVTRSEMAGLADDDLVDLFRELTDDKAWSGGAPDDLGRRGGSLLASRELAEMAKLQPERAIKLLPRFQPGRQERPTGMVLKALAELPEFPAEQVLQHIDDLVQRGFDSADFRDEVIGALRTLAARSGGLDDRHIELIAGWLVPVEATAAVPRWVDDDDSVSEPNNITPVIFQDHVSGAIDGNSFQLGAILEGYRHRNPIDTDGAVAFLDRHLDFPEDPKVWRHLAHFDLVQLAFGAGANVDAFFARLYAERGDDLGPRAAISLLGFLYRFRPRDWVMVQARRFAQHGGSEERAHWAGELLGLLAVTQIGGAEAALLLDSALMDPDPACARQARRGAAFATFEALAATADGDFEGVSDRALKLYQKLAALVDTDASSSANLPRTFFKVSGSDHRAGQILKILLEHPANLDAADGMYFLLDRVADGFAAGALSERLIIELLEVIHAQNARGVGNVTQAFAGEAGDLVALLVTLTRSTDPKVYDRALHLFERLLSDRVHAATAAARTADNPFFRS